MEKQPLLGRSWRGKMGQFPRRARWYPLSKLEINILRNFASRNLSLRATHVSTRMDTKDILTLLVLAKP